MGAQVTKEVEQTLQAGVVTPVKVLDRQDQRRPVRKVEEEPSQSLEEPAFLVLRTKAGSILFRRGKYVGKEPGEHRVDRGGGVPGNPEPLELSD